MRYLSYQTLRMICLALVAVVMSPAQTVSIQGTNLDVDIYGNIYVLDAATSTLKMYDSKGALRIEGGGPGWENGRFDQPSGLWARNGIDVYVADYANHRIQRFDRALSFVSVLSTRESENANERFGYPGDVTLSRLGEMYVCDTENGRILKVGSRNTVELTFGGFGGGAGRLHSPQQVEIGVNDQVYVLDPPRVLIYDSFGNYLSALPDGILKRPSILFADERGCVVVDGDTMVCFDGSNRLTLSLLVSQLLRGQHVTARSFVLASGQIYILSDEGLFIEPDPRPARLD
jgi:DNA-binding beta-propeller fold protein YncE